MCVASYGVMPQTYIRAVGPDAAGTTLPVLVSCRRTVGPRPGRSGTDGAGQRFTLVRLPARPEGAGPSGPGAAGLTCRHDRPEVHDQRALHDQRSLHDHGVGRAEPSPAA